MHIELPLILSQDTIFYILCFISIAFVVFVYVSRYVTRHQVHDHDDDEETDTV